MNPFTDSDDDNLGIDIFAALKGAVQSQDVQAAWSKVKSPIPAIQGIAGGPKAPSVSLPPWLTQFGKPIATLTKAVVSQVKSQPTTAPATNPQGDPVVPSAGSVAPIVTKTNTAMVVAGAGMIGAAIYLLTRKR